MFDKLIDRHNRQAVHYAGRSYSYDQLLQYTQLYANYYQSRCSEKIERVMFFSKNTPEYIFAIYGALRIGAITIPVDATSTSRELSYMMGDSKPQIIYTTRDNLELVEECIGIVQKSDTKYSPVLFTAEDIDAGGVKLLPIEPVLPGGVDDIMTIIYTSGTTGSPKGVMLTYGNLWYNIDAVCNLTGIFHTESRTLMILPLHHIFAYAGALLAPLYSGGQIYILESLTPEAILGTLKEGRITIMIGVPRLYETLAKGIMSKIKANAIAHALYKLCSFVGSEALSKRVFKSVHDTFGGAMEYFVSGGAALPIETGNIFKNLGFYVLEGYGMTECAPMIAFTRPGERAVGYCGRILPGCEYKIGESDELLVRGANMMKGYYNRPEETAAIIRDGWLHTGDTARYHEKFGIQITGRIKEIIVTPNGKNINPAQIENEITQESTIIKEIAIVLHEDILQAIVYPDLAAVSKSVDGTLDELVRAEIERYNREAQGYKRIMRYHIISHELPKTRLGKTQRFKLAELMTAREEAPREDVSERSEIYQLIKSFLDEQTGQYANGDSHFEIDLALDSLGRVSLLSYIEDSFGVRIEEGQLADLSTLNLLSAYVEERSESTTLSDGEVSWNEILRSAEGQVKLPRSGFLHWLIHMVLWIFFSVFYRYTSCGEKSIPKSPVLFVANHRSGFDGVFITAKLKWKIIHNTFFFAKDKHFQGGFKEYMAERNNIILMNVNTNVRESMQQMYQVLSQGYNVVIFPEGTRSKDGSMKSFKESFAILSESLSIPVVPIAICGSEAATYRKIRLPRFGCQINVEFLPQMIANDGESSAEFAERVKAAINSAIVGRK
ncbi:MAG: AMP-binding protein [Rikenellaceae bacterium]